VPAKRQEEGLFPALSVWDNLAVATLGRHSRFGLFRTAPIDRSVDEQLARLGVVPPGSKTPISALSGGNAQKVLIGRWLAANPWLLLLNDPLRGVDLGTKLDFYDRLRVLAQNGTSVVLLSTEIEELLTACDRVAVCRNHAVRAVLCAEGLSHAAILAEMFGQPVRETEDVQS
jgi:ribose transport system ATP-binding protein